MDACSGHMGCEIRSRRLVFVVAFATFGIARLDGASCKVAAPGSTEANASADNSRALLLFQTRALSQQPIAVGQLPQVQMEPPAQLRRTVAVLISGALRTLAVCNESFVKNVVKVNPTMEFHTYVYSSVESFSDAKKTRQFVPHSLPNVEKAIFAVDSEVEDELRVKLPGLDLVPSGNTTQKGKALNIAKQFYGFHHVRRLVGDALHSYDLVLRLRPDTFFCRPLDLSLIVDAAVYLPWFHLNADPKLAFDQFAAGPPGPMDTYFAAFQTFSKVVLAGDDVYPEGFFGKHLSSAKVPVRRLLGFRTSLARSYANGTTFLADPFANLRADFPDLTMPSASEACSLP